MKIKTLAARIAWTIVNIMGLDTLLNIQGNNFKIKKDHLRLNHN
jgi:hypothetical protein